MSDLNDFCACYELAGGIIASASKEDVAEAARLLALNVAHYRQKYGALPFENFGVMLRATTINAETAGLLAAGTMAWLAVVDASEPEDHAMTRTESNPDLGTQRTDASPAIIKRRVVSMSARVGSG